jgi:glycosyltransferase involved in cell wall biosynthesis
MRILLIHQYFLEENDSGGSRWNEMTKVWLDQGHEIVILAGMMHANGNSKRPEYKGRFFVEKDQGGIKVLRCHVSESYNSGFAGRLWGYFSFVFSSLWALLFKVKGKYDVIIVTSPPLFLAIPGIIYSKMKNIPMVFEIRDLWPESAIDTGIVTNKHIISLAYWLENKSYQHSKLINVLTPAFKEILVNKKKINPKKIIFIPNASDFRLSDELLTSFNSLEFRKNLGWEDKFVALYVGAHGVANHLQQVLDAAKLLQPENVYFVFIGSGMEKDKLKKISEDNRLDNVLFLDPVSKNDIFKYILSCDVGLSVLKKVDTFKTVYSNKTFDYMACKKPILMAIDGISRELVETANAGSYVEPEDPEALAQAVRKYMSNKALEVEHGENGYMYAKSNFDRTILAKRYLACVEEII